MDEIVKEKIDLNQSRPELRRKIREISKETKVPMKKLWHDFMETKNKIQDKKEKEGNK